MRATAAGLSTLIGPLTFLKRGETKDLAQALAVYRIAIVHWFEDALSTLRRAGARDGEVSHFTTIITYTTYTPAAPAIPSLTP